MWARIRRAARKPPAEIARRLAHEAAVEWERIAAPRRGRSFDGRALLLATGAASFDELWSELAARPFLAWTGPLTVGEIDGLAPGEAARIVKAADRALRRRVDLLGSGPTELGSPIRWSRDAKSGVEWPRDYGPRITYVYPGDDSDVKWPWELSRVQWLIPLGQAYRLTGDERYAAAARDVLEEWIGANPYPLGVNWSIAMEPALRVLSWTWLFHALHGSLSWSDPAFRTRFLSTLWLKADFVERHWERSDVNGNHYDADAAGLVVAGLFFGRGRAAARWMERGWEALVTELPRQVHPDGIDFEASTAYHRLVLELFLLPALHRLAQGLDVPQAYRERLLAMARFIATYSRPDGSVPLWGDADDGRALPLGGQGVNDHRHLVAAVGLSFGDDELIAAAGVRARADVLWLLGAEAAGRLADGATSAGSKLFPDGGVCVLRNGRDHVFVDCGGVGLRGRGGHGHNDCLSVDATLDGETLLVDCGSYVYTASPEWRNRFRSTAFHNTPVVDGEEQARISADSLWRIEPDAEPTVIEWTPGPLRDRLVAMHAGYLRLASPVRVTREVELGHEAHELRIHDLFDGAGAHLVAVSLHLAPGVEATAAEPGSVSLATAAGRRFDLLWESSADWTLGVGEGWVSPSYGVRSPVVRLDFEREGPLAPLTITVRATP